MLALLFVLHSIKNLSHCNFSLFSHTHISLSRSFGHSRIIFSNTNQTFLMLLSVTQMNKNGRRFHLQPKTSKKIRNVFHVLSVIRAFCTIKNGHIAHIISICSELNIFPSFYMYFRYYEFRYNESYSNRPICSLYREFPVLVSVKLDSAERS